MDKNAIKKYAVWARRELISRVSQKALQYGITDSGYGEKDTDSVNGVLLSAAEKSQRKALIQKMLGFIDYKNGYEQVIEEVAYTWFNRFTALRFMEVNGYLPTHIRVFTDDNNAFKPQILAEALHLDLSGMDKNKALQLKQNNKDDELYKYLLISQCNALGEVLPGMFQKISNYAELLFPDNLLREGSVIGRMIIEIPESDWNVGEDGQVEIIGWLYQYYISEKHDEVVDPLHGKVVKKEDVPAATQLFTTDWVVRYITDNSVGRYWIERKPESSLAGELQYFIKPKQGISFVKDTIDPKELTVFDPCVGSGHFLIYAFEVLIKIYNECGYSTRDAVSSIVRNNLYGLDIDERATQLAYFAVMMKARSYDGRFFTRDIQPNIYAIEESNNIDSDLLEYFCGSNDALKHDIMSVIADMHDAKEYGSIISVKSVNFEALYTRFDEILDNTNFRSYIVWRDLLPIVKVAEILSKKYKTVITNPPYLNKYSAKLKAFIETNYEDYKGDLFSVFMFRNFDFCERDGYSGFMTPFVWMFIKTYEKLRNYIIQNKSIASLIQMEYSAYDEATVPICSFVLKNGMELGKGLYLRLSDFVGGMEVQRQKVLEALNSADCAYMYEVNQSNFAKIPSSSIAYWASNNIVDIFYNNKLLVEVAEPKQGIATADNNKYLRLWYECKKEAVALDCASHAESENRTEKWYPYNKGGEFRKWYGNNDYVVLWEHDGFTLKHDKKAVLRNPTYYFKSCMTWSLVSSSTISFRYKPVGGLFDVAGMSCFCDSDNFHYLLGLLNTCLVDKFMAMLAPTINYQVGNISNVPIKIDENQKDNVTKIVQTNISISKIDWDSFETSWDFKKHPLVRAVSKIVDAYAEWEAECKYRFNILKANEEELNHIFIDIYGLQDELMPEVEDKDVTVRKADLQREIKSLISYAVGCMFGRYSLDVEGLAYAGGAWDDSKYITYKSDTDNILPICDDEYFEDDIVGRFVKFIEIVYGIDTLEENLQFIANALGGKGSAREVIRDYFNNGFYADHCKTYQKRPIYWLFSSGKKGGFKALVYMHRYKPDTIARMRTDYVHEQQARYRTVIADLERRMSGASTSERVKLNKRLIEVRAQASEILGYEEKIHHLADQMISIDLDDGVVKNYAKFEDVLAKIK